MRTRASSGSSALWGRVLRALVIFGGTLAIAITFLLSPASQALRNLLESFLAQTAATFLRLFDPSTSVTGSTISINGFAAEIVPACTGLFTTSIFLAAVLAYPSSLPRKLQGIALGVLGIMALNWIRIITLLLIGGYYYPAFEFTHLILWRSLVIFGAAVLWLFWIQRFAHAAP